MRKLILTVIVMVLSSGSLEACGKRRFTPVQNMIHRIETRSIVRTKTRIVNRVIPTNNVTVQPVIAPNCSNGSCQLPSKK